jgi:hypothetical protein
MEEKKAILKDIKIDIMKDLMKYSLMKNIKMKYNSLPMKKNPSKLILMISMIMLHKLGFKMHRLIQIFRMILIINKEIIRKDVI